MVLAQIFIQPEAAYHTISELGEIGVVQFRDVRIFLHKAIILISNFWWGFSVEQRRECVSKKVCSGSEEMRRNGKEVEIYGGGGKEGESVDFGCDWNSKSAESEGNYWLGGKCNK